MKPLVSRASSLHSRRSGWAAMGRTTSLTFHLCLSSGRRASIAADRCHQLHLKPAFAAMNAPFVQRAWRQSSSTSAPTAGEVLRRGPFGPRQIGKTTTILGKILRAVRSGIARWTWLFMRHLPRSSERYRPSTGSYLQTPRWLNRASCEAGHHTSAELLTPHGPGGPR